MLPGKHAAAPHRHAAELAVACGDIDPVAVMQVQHRARRHLHMRLKSLAMNRGGGKHSHTHQRVGIVDLDAHLGGADLRIEDGADVADHASQDAVGIGREANVRLLAKMHRGEIVLVDIADDPDVRQVGDGKGIGRTGIGDASSTRQWSHSAR